MGDESNLDSNLDEVFDADMEKGKKCKWVAEVKDF